MVVSLSIPMGNLLTKVYLSDLPPAPKRKSSAADTNLFRLFLVFPMPR
jgi:hypothetical protein